MYYWILYTVCSLFPGVFSKWFVLGINIVAYGISLVFIYLTAGRLFGKTHKAYLPLLVTACFAFSPATISSVMFIRMYALLACLILISFYLHVRAWQEDRMTHPVFLLMMAVLVYLTYPACLGQMFRGQRGA